MKENKLITENMNRLAPKETKQPYRDAKGRFAKAPNITVGELAELNTKNPNVEKPRIPAMVCRKESCVRAETMKELQKRLNKTDLNAKVEGKCRTYRIKQWLQSKLKSWRSYLQGMLQGFRKTRLKK